MGMIFMVPLFMAAEYVTGRGGALFKAPGRSIWYVGPALALALWFVPYHGLPLWSLGVAWALWRGVLGWSSFGGSEDPTTARQLEGEGLRDLVAYLFLLLPLPLFPLALRIPLAIGAFVFTFCHLALALAQGDEAEEGRDITPGVDLARGAVFGLIWALVLGGGIQ